MEISISCTVSILKVHLLCYLGPAFGNLTHLLLVLGVFCIYLYIFLNENIREQAQSKKI